MKILLTFLTIVFFNFGVSAETYICKPDDMRFFKFKRISNDFFEDAGSKYKIIFENNVFVTLAKGWSTGGEFTSYYVVMINKKTLVIQLVWLNGPFDKQIRPSVMSGRCTL